MIPQLSWFQDPIMQKITIGTLVSTIPLLIYIAFKTPEDDGAWLGKFGVLVIGLLRRLKYGKKEGVEGILKKMKIIDSGSVESSKSTPLEENSR